jgi:hypothetical protein
MLGSCANELYEILMQSDEDGVRSEDTRKQVGVVNIIVEIAGN